MVALPGGLVAVPGPRDVRRGDLVQGAAPGASRPQGACPVGGPVLGEPTSRADTGLVGLFGGRRPAAGGTGGRVWPRHLGWGRLAWSPEKRDSGPDSPDAGASGPGGGAGLPGRRAGGRPRRAPGRGPRPRVGRGRWTISPGFPPFLGGVWSVRGATGEPLAIFRPWAVVANDMMVFFMRRRRGEWGDAASTWPTGPRGNWNRGGVGMYRPPSPTPSRALTS